MHVQLFLGRSEQVVVTEAMVHTCTHAQRENRGSHGAPRKAQSVLGDLKDCAG